MLCSHDCCKPISSPTTPAVKGEKVQIAPTYHSSNHLIRLAGQTDGAINDVKCISVPALIDSGAQMSMVIQGFCEKHGLNIHPLDKFM